VQTDCISPEIGAVDLSVVIDEIDRHLRKLGAQAIVVLHPDFFWEWAGSAAGSWRGPTRMVHEHGRGMAGGCVGRAVPDVLVLPPTATHPGVRDRGGILCHSEDDETLLSSNVARISTERCSLTNRTTASALGNNDVFISTFLSGVLRRNEWPRNTAPTISCQPILVSDKNPRGPKTKLCLTPSLSSSIDKRE